MRAAVQSISLRSITQPQQLKRTFIRPLLPRTVQDSGYGDPVQVLPYSITRGENRSDGQRSNRSA